MSFEVLGDLNWLAVIVATIAYFALGAVWFARPVFGGAWMRSMDWEMSQGEQPGPALYIGPLITCLLASIAVGMLAEATGSDTFSEGIALGLVVGVGVAGSVLFVTGVFDPKKAQPMTWFAVSAGYHLVGLLIASVIVSSWT
jgi:uncharacterized protein DUF1761